MPDFDQWFEQIREPKRKGGFTYTPGEEDRIVFRLNQLGITLNEYQINVTEYHSYFEAAQYASRYPNYYSFNLPEKTLEHYIAADLLHLSPQDTYVDVASENSPVPEIYERLFGASAYRQDLSYPPGVQGKRIGGDASQMPVEDVFASKMGLHCSYEHFEGDSDIRFIRELARVLKPGGKACFVPLYMAEHYFIQTDPCISGPSGVAFEADATVCCAKGWNNRHGRYYNPEKLLERVLQPDSPFQFTLYRISNFTEVDPSCYCRFALLLER